MHSQRDKIQEDDMLIYNWIPHFTGRSPEGGEEQDFEQAYFFDVQHIRSKARTMAAQRTAA